MKQPQSTPSPPAPGVRPDRLCELRVSGYLMRLDPGLFCVVHMPTPGADAASGLPGVRLSRAPSPGGQPDGLQITGFTTDGWLSGAGDAALVRVSGGPAQILVTIYQEREGQSVGTPNLQVRRLLEAEGAGATPMDAASARQPPSAVAAAPARAMDLLAHIQERGDVGAKLGEWVGERGSKRWIEGFGIAPAIDIAASDIEYQAVLGPGWLSPWVEGGQFCGSRGMALPLLGLRVRLRGDAALAYDVRYAASFVDGSRVGPVGDGEKCETESLSPLESLLVEVVPRAEAAAAASPARPTPARPFPARSTSARPSLGVAAGKAAPGAEPPRKIALAKR